MNDAAYSDAGNRGSGVSLREHIAATLFVITQIAFSIIGFLMPRADKATEMREILRGWHYLTGTVLFLLAAYLLVKIWQRRHVPIDRFAGKQFNKWAVTLIIATLLMFVISPFFGVLNAWSSGLKIHMGPTPDLPSLVSENRAVWMFVGYFHSAIGMVINLLQLFAVLTLGYAILRFGRNPFQAFPVWFSAYAITGTAATVYALATFASPAPGPGAVARFAAIIAVVWFLGWFLHRMLKLNRAPIEGSTSPNLLALLGCLIPVGLGIYGPYGFFRVLPFEPKATVVAAEGVTSHDATITRVTVYPETELERQVREENYKWCTFCHTVEKGGKHKVGPNLYAIFGQQIATVPNFGYTKNLVQRGENGEVWTDETMSELLEDPDRFAPGTSMIVSSGNIADPAKRAALINILKKETMGDAIDFVDEPDPNQ